MSRHARGAVIKVPVWVAICIALVIAAMIGIVIPVIALVFGGHHYQ
jgi:Mg/Co/Ni transporter MgtE